MDGLPPIHTSNPLPAPVQEHVNEMAGTMATHHLTERVTRLKEVEQETAGRLYREAKQEQELAPVSEPVTPEDTRAGGDPVQTGASSASSAQAPLVRPKYPQMDTPPNRRPQAPITQIYQGDWHVSYRAMSGHASRLANAMPRYLSHKLRHSDLSGGTVDARVAHHFLAPSCAHN